MPQKKLLVLDKCLVLLPLLPPEDSFLNKMLLKFIVLLISSKEETFSVIIVKSLSLNSLVSLTYSIISLNSLYLLMMVSLENNKFWPVLIVESYLLLYLPLKLMECLLDNY